MRSRFGERKRFGIKGQDIYTLLMSVLLGGFICIFLYDDIADYKSRLAYREYVEAEATIEEINKHSDGVSYFISYEVDGHVYHEEYEPSLFSFKEEGDTIEIFYAKDNPGKIIYKISVVGRVVGVIVTIIIFTITAVITPLDRWQQIRQYNYLLENGLIIEGEVINVESMYYNKGTSYVVHCKIMINGEERILKSRMTRIKPEEKVGDKAWACVDIKNPLCYIMLCDVDHVGT